MTIARCTAAFGLFVASAKADKDDSYYIAGTGNPNKDERMYWKDAENIFQDLSQFEELHVEFHNCAWTWMMMSDEDNDIEENDYWYVGKIPPMGANVAYSLYGSLKGESFSGCGKETFINSFYTNSGFTNFARAMNYAGLSGFSSYSYDDSAAQCGGGYGVGCDYSNGFAVHTYADDTCDPSTYTGVQDKMENLNSAMNKATCVQIYNGNTYNGSPYGTALELLAYSHSCFYQDFFSPDGECPDPYGKLAYYQKQFYSGIQESKKQDPYQVAQRKELYTTEIKYGKIMSLAGIALAALAAVILFYECLLACFGYKDAKMREYTPQGTGFIITKHSEDDMISSPTIADKSESVSRTGSEMYVTMSISGDAYAPPTTPQDGASTSAVPPMHEVAAPPPVAILPTPVPSPTQAVAPTPVSLPSANAHAPLAAHTTPVPSPAQGSAIAQGIETNSSPAILSQQGAVASTAVRPTHPGNARGDPGQPVTVTLYSPPSMAQAPETVVVADIKAKEAPPVPKSDPAIEALEEQLAQLAIKLHDVQKFSTSKLTNTAKEALAASEVTLKSEPTPETLPLAEAPSMKSLPEVVSPKPLFAGNLDSSSELPLPVDTNVDKVMTSYKEYSSNEEAKGGPEGKGLKGASNSQLGSSSTCPEIQVANTTKSELAPEVPPLAKAPSVKSLSDIESPPKLLTGIPGSSAELEG